MTLRVKFMLTLLALVIPFGIAVTYYQISHHERVVREAISDQLQSRVGPRERALCEARPDAWPQVGRGRRRRRRNRARPEMYAYSQSFESQNSAAPNFPESLRKALESQDEASERLEDGIQVAVRMPWREGPCAVILLRRHLPLGRQPGDPWFPGILITLGAVVLALFATSPMVGRIKRLTEAVTADEDLSGITGQDEVAELAQAFEKKRKLLRARMDQVESQGQTLRDYVADTAHDVMVPVTVLQGHLSAFRRRTEEGKALDLDRIQEAIGECHYLTSVFRNLSISAKLDAQPELLAEEPVDLNQLVERVVSRYRTLADASEVGLEYAVPDEPVVATGDVTLLEQAVGNLVHNAIRYNRQNGHVALVLDWTGDNAFALSVVDDGPGMQPEDLEKITDRGYRSDKARSRHPSGLGLGLAIAKDVAKQHGLTLSFETGAQGETAPDEEAGATGLTVTLAGPCGQRSSHL